MKKISAAAVLCLGVAAMAQDTRFDYDRSANFAGYKTYQWVNDKQIHPGDQLIDQDIKRAVDEQLAGKGLRRVETRGDLYADYQASISHEKEFDNLGWGGPPWFAGWGNSRVVTSTIDVGALAIGLFDPARKQLVWRGVASKTINVSKDPAKNYRTLERAMAKLFKSYPPGSDKK